MAEVGFAMARRRPELQNPDPCPVEQRWRSAFYQLNNQTELLTDDAPAPSDWHVPLRKIQSFMLDDVLRYSTGALYGFLSLDDSQTRKENCLKMIMDLRKEDLVLFLERVSLDLKEIQDLFDPSPDLIVGVTIFCHRLMARFDPKSFGSQLFEVMHVCVRMFRALPTDLQWRWEAQTSTLRDHLDHQPIGYRYRMVQVNSLRGLVFLVCAQRRRQDRAMFATFARSIEKFLRHYDDDLGVDVEELLRDLEGDHFIPLLAAIPEMNLVVDLLTTLLAKSRNPRTTHRFLLGMAPSWLLQWARSIELGTLSSSPSSIETEFLWQALKSAICSTSDGILWLPDLVRVLCLPPPEFERVRVEEPMRRNLICRLLAFAKKTVLYEKACRFVTWVWTAFSLSREHHETSAGLDDAKRIELALLEERVEMDGNTEDVSFILEDTLRVLISDLEQIKQVNQELWRMKVDAVNECFKATTVEGQQIPSLLSSRLLSPDIRDALATFYAPLTSGHKRPRDGEPTADAKRRKEESVVAQAQPTSQIPISDLWHMNGHSEAVNEEMVSYFDNQLNQINNAEELERTIQRFEIMESPHDATKSDKELLFKTKVLLCVVGQWDCRGNTTLSNLQVRQEFVKRFFRGKGLGRALAGGLLVYYPDLIHLVMSRIFGEFQQAYDPSDLDLWLVVVRYCSERFCSLLRDRIYARQIRGPVINETELRRIFKTDLDAQEQTFLWDFIVRDLMRRPLQDVVTFVSASCSCVTSLSDDDRHSMGVSSLIASLTALCGSRPDCATEIIPLMRNVPAELSLWYAGTLAQWTDQRQVQPDPDGVVVALRQQLRELEAGASMSAVQCQAMVTLAEHLRPVLLQAHQRADFLDSFIRLFTAREAAAGVLEGRERPEE